jgi:hypothetical protein
VKGVDNLKKGKPVEVGVSRADARDPVLAKQDRRMGVVQYVPTEMRQLFEYLRSDRRMSWRWHQDIDAR